MNIIIPMAGKGKRMRPHTLTIPKPLIPIAGKPIVQRLVEDIVKVCNEPIENIVFIIHPSFGKETEDKLIEIAKDENSNGIIAYQDEALGTAHAIFCARDYLKGKVTVAFADTLFKADFRMDTKTEGIIWVQEVENPSAFGVVKTNEDGDITDFIEKPQTPVSNMAIIGIYFFREGEILHDEIKYLIDHNIKEKGEFQLTNALESMKNKGIKFKPEKISEWLDCGNKENTVYTNQRYLDYLKGSEELKVPASCVIKNSLLVPPVYISENVEIIGSIIGPFVSVGKNTKIHQSIVQNSLIQEESFLKNLNLSNSMIGNSVSLEGKSNDLNIGDFSQMML